MAKALLQHVHMCVSDGEDITGGLSKTKNFGENEYGNYRSGLTIYVREYIDIGVIITNIIIMDVHCDYVHVFYRAS